MFFIGNTFFVLFGSGEIQKWNEPIMSQTTECKVKTNSFKIDIIITDESQLFQAMFTIRPKVLLVIMKCSKLENQLLRGNKTVQIILSEPVYQLLFKIVSILLDMSYLLLLHL